MAAIAGTELPIIQAPMAGAQGSAMTIAVSGAGGLGSLACAMLSPEQLEGELQSIRASTDKPFNLNFFCHRLPTLDEAGDAAWRALLDPYCRELGIASDSIPRGSARAPFDQHIADAIAPFRPPVVSFHFGLPAADLVEQVKSWGAIVMSSATTVEEALWLESRGADVIIAQGLEAGGHRGMFLEQDVTTQVGTLALLPQVLAAVEVPVVAAGGIADGAGVAAAMALGASAAQVGTSYLLCPEATISPLHRLALASERARHTALTNLFTGRPARGIVNRLIREQGPINRQAPAFPLAAPAIQALRAAAEAAESDDFSPLWCGQNASGCKAIPAAELTLELAAGVRAPRARFPVD